MQQAASGFLRSFPIMTRAGDAPRSRRILRLIALERSVRSVLLLAAGIYLLTHLKSDFGRIADHFMRALELDPRRPFLHRIVVRLAHDLLASVGLWLDQLWAEYLTVIATSLLLPLELYELVSKPSLLKAGGIVVNIAIVAYLAWMLRRRLPREAAHA